MSKVDFKNISFIIHIRIDIPERLLNLATVMDMYHEMCDNVEFVIINDDKEPDSRLRPLYEKYGETSKFLFLQNDDIYRRPMAFNKGFTNTDRPTMIAGDTDVLIHPTYLKQAEEKIHSGECQHIYPYNGMFIHIKEHIRDDFKKDYDFDKLLKLKPSEHNRYPYYETNDILIAHTASRGGCIMYESKMYNDINGYNPEFRGWGYEDDEINCRIKKLGYSMDRVHDDDAIAWHLPHPNTVRDQHPYYDNNNRLSELTGQLTPEQIRELITTWKM